MHDPEHIFDQEPAEQPGATRPQASARDSDGTPEQWAPEEDVPAAGRDATAATNDAPDAAREKLEQEIAELRDQLLRAQAETQNARRRGDEAVAKARKFSIGGFAEDLLSVVDSLEAALGVKNATAEQLYEGTQATHKQLMSALQKNKVQVISPDPGAKFDPNQHHAISMVPAPGQAAGTVVNVLQKGYLIAERVLRPALVTVAEAGGKNGGD